MGFPGNAGPPGEAGPNVSIFVVLSIICSDVLIL